MTNRLGGVVDPDGPDANGQAFLQEAKTNGTRIDVINVMTMDYYGGSASGLPQCSEISQQPLDFTRLFTQYTG